MTPQRKVLSKETTNPLQSQTADLQMKGRRRSAGQLLSIANNCDDWKKFYVSLVINYISQLIFYFFVV
jgi:hypothetical protein